MTDFVTYVHFTILHSRLQSSRFHDFFWKIVCVPFHRKGFFTLVLKPRPGRPLAPVFLMTNNCPPLTFPSSVLVDPEVTNGLFHCISRLLKNKCKIPAQFLFGIAEKIKTKDFGFWSPADAMKQTINVRKVRASKGQRSDSISQMSKIDRFEQFSSVRIDDQNLSN